MQYKIVLLLLATAFCFNYLPEVEIDLSAPPRQRWKESVRTVLDLYGYDNSFGPVFEFHNENTFYILTPEDYTTIAKAIRKNFPEYSLELEGIVEEFNRSNITFEYMAAWAYFHEIGHITNDVTECTGVLLSIGDQVIHGRNMDQYPGQARNIVLHLTIKKDGKYLGESVDWYWFKVGFVIIIQYQIQIYFIEIQCCISRRKLEIWKCFEQRLIINLYLIRSTIKINNFQLYLHQHGHIEMFWQMKS